MNTDHHSSFRYVICTTVNHTATFSLRTEQIRSIRVYLWQKQFTKVRDAENSYWR
jgi:hypothetical protein